MFLKGEGKDEKDPRSYRPICLLSVIGKLFEKLLMKRLNKTVLSPRTDLRQTVRVYARKVDGGRDPGAATHRRFF